jgi:hypothetical protein
MSAALSKFGIPMSCDAGAYGKSICKKRLFEPSTSFKTS